MGGTYSGRDLKLYVGKETTFGTKASSFTAVKINDTSGGIKMEYKTSEARVGQRAKDGTFTVAKLGERNFPVEIYPDTIGLLLKGLLGGESVALASGASIAYEHTFTPDDTIPSFTVQVNYAGVKTYNNLGFVIDSMDFEFATKDIAKATVNGNFQDEEEEASGESGTFSSLLPFLCKNMLLKIDGSTFAEAKNAKITISNNINKDDYRLNQSDKVASLSPGEFTVTGELQVVFNTDSYNLRTKYLNGSSASMEITLESTEEIESGYPYKLIITLPEINFTGGDIGTEVEGMTMTLPFEAFIPSSGEIVTIVLTNEDSSEY